MGIPPKHLRINPGGPPRYPYDEMNLPDHLSGISPEDVIMSRLPPRRGELLKPPMMSRGPPPPPPPNYGGPRPRGLPSPYSMNSSRDGRGNYPPDIDEYGPPPSSAAAAYHRHLVSSGPPPPPPHSSAYINSKSFGVPPRKPPRFEVPIRGGGNMRYPPTHPSYSPDVERFLSGPPPPSRESNNNVPGINFTLASQQPRNRTHHHPPPPPHSMHHMQDW